jgi:hypothetical protein
MPNKRQYWDEVQVELPEEIAAVRSGDLPGTIYRDGAVFADVEALKAFWGLRPDSASAPTSQ